MTVLRALALCLATFPAVAAGGDGMWLPHQVKDLDLESQGLQISPDSIYREDGTGLMSAVVTFSDGGTAEFVSTSGLLLTNHHIASPALQRVSTKDKDYLKDGFIAQNRQNEMPAIGFAVDVLLGYEDVTREFTAALVPGLSPRQRYGIVEQTTNRLIARAESQARDARAVVARMHSGNTYYLYRFKRIRDVRVVYAPPLSLGRFGGDVDNWMWPRHASDFAFMRAYVSKQGEGVEYDPSNVPYVPKSVIRIAREDVDEGDFTFVMGYPHLTFRNNTVAELRFDLGRLRRRADTFTDSIEFLGKAGRDNADVRIRYATSVRQLNNATKNYRAKLEKIGTYRVIEDKERSERTIMDWVTGDDARRREYGTMLADLESFMSRFEAHAIRAQALQDVVDPFPNTTLLGQAHLIYRTAIEKQKPDAERDPEFQERNLADIRKRVEFAEREYALATDRAYLEHRLASFFQTYPQYASRGLREAFGDGSPKTIAASVGRLYAGTSMADAARRLAYLDMDPATLLKQDDPLVQLAADLEGDLALVREEGKALNQERVDRRQPFEKALLEKHGGRVAPDANETLRFTYGTVEGYRPRDAVQLRPQTTLAGLIEKDRGAPPFEVPPKLAALYRDRDFGRFMDPELNDVPVGLLTSTLITGGNSGSPTFNAKGELIGIVFDMTYESVTADYFVRPEIRRTVSVDVRNVLFLTEKLAGAKHILVELGF